MKTLALPFFSIIIPTYNRPQQLAACLQSLAQLEYPRERFEVIVVDDGSPTSLEMASARVRQQICVRLIQQANSGPAAARNNGAKQAKGDFLVFTDDDCTPAPDWLQKLATIFKENPECLAGGRTVNRLPDNLFSTTSQLIVDIVYRHYNADPQHARFFASNNMAMPAQRFHELGGFNANFRTSEDRELCDRWRQRGWQMIYAEDAIIYHAHDLTFVEFCRQHFNYGRGAYRYHQIRRQRGSGTMHGEMKFHANLRNWLLYPFTQVRWNKALPLAGSLLLWQILNAAGFFGEALKQKKQDDAKC
jgi:GT2 family glycosyltransferase